MPSSTGGTCASRRPSGVDSASRGSRNRKQAAAIGTKAAGAQLSALSATRVPTSTQIAPPAVAHQPSQPQAVARTTSMVAAVTTRR